MMGSERARFDNGLPAPPAGLDEMLSGIARGIVAAQGELDRSARETSENVAILPDREVHLRPLWFLFDRVTVDLELSTFVARGSKLQCRVVDPVAIALRGHAQSTGTKVRIEIAPLGAGLVRRE